MDKIKVNRISREEAPVQIIINHKELENVEYFNYLSSMITNKQVELEPALPWKSSIQQKEDSLTRKLYLNLRKKLVNCSMWSVVCMAMKLGHVRK